MLPGNCFGQAAFESHENKATIRKETAIAQEYTSFAVLNREDFMRVLRKFEKREGEQSLSFIKKIPFFSKMSLAKAKKLQNISEEQVYYRNQFVYQQGEMPAFAYIVKSGEFEIYRTHRPRQCLSIDKR